MQNHKMKVNLSAGSGPLGTSEDFSLCFLSKPSKPTELRNQELIDNSELFVTRQKSVR